MPEKSSAIILNKRKYGDKSLIINLLTQKNGLLSCFIKNAFAKSKRIDRIQPLTGVEVVYSLRENRELAFLQEILVTEARSVVFSDVIRTSVAFYMAELLNRVIRGHLQPDDTLYKMIQLYMHRLEHNPVAESDIHLRFTMDLITAMGFKPVHESGAPLHFSLTEGIIGPDPYGKHVVSGDQVQLAAGFFAQGEFPFKPNKTQRAALFALLTTYLDYQLGDALNLKSPAVLQEILN